jgi:hypothetical protein
MTSRIAKSVTVALFSCLTGVASAGIPAIDLFNVAGVPGTGGYSTVSGPCYCDQTAYFSPIMLLRPGTYDFGKVRDYWVKSDPTPDGGPDQPNEYLLFNPVDTTGSYPEDFPAQTSYSFPGNVLCDQADDACNARYVGAYQDFDLIFAVPPGQDAMQVGLVGPYVYTSPLPEPLTIAMFALGLILTAGLSARPVQPD